MLFVHFGNKRRSNGYLPINQELPCRGRSQSAELLLAWMFLWFTCLDQPAIAADVRVVHAGLWFDEIPASAYQDGTADESPKCNVTFSGDIEPGDLAKLKLAYEVAQKPRKHTPSFLCLNSEGGDLHEALAIIRWLLRSDGRGIATAITGRQVLLFSLCLCFHGGQ